MIVQKLKHLVKRVLLPVEVERLKIIFKGFDDLIEKKDCGFVFAKSL